MTFLQVPAFEQYIGGFWPCLQIACLVVSKPHGPFSLLSVRHTETDLPCESVAKGMQEVRPSVLRLQVVLEVQI
jgi:hypothetical protein